MPRKLLVGGSQRCGSLKGVKKVSPPTVPALPLPTANHVKRHSTSNPCVCNGDELGEVTPDLEESVEVILNHVASSRRQYRTSSVGNSYSHVSFSSQNHSQHQTSSMKKGIIGSRTGSNGQIHLAHVIVHSQPDSLPVTPVESSHSPSLMKGRLMSGTQASLEDQGIDVSSPGRHSPGGSSGGSSVSRHSLSSLDSGRASAPGSESKVISRRLSVHSYESTGSPQRRSYHSSSSSLASSGEDPHGTVSASSAVSMNISALGQGPNVAEMVLHGLPDVEVLSNWLASLHFEEYIPLFLQAGYDMPTITRMTPEDLTAIGITKPNHRRKMKAEIAKLNISDAIPEYKPDTLLEWLQLLRLEEYYSTLCEQQYDTIDRVTELTWEDLEDIGISKLGHQKKILLAIKRIEDINQGRRPNLIPASKTQQYMEFSANSSTSYMRPSTLNSIQPYAYPAQEVAIAMQRPKNSPSTDSIPEMKTFQQSPIREENTLPEEPIISSSTLSSSVAQQALLPVSSTVPYHQNGSSNYALSPCRGRSLESLHSDENVPVSIATLQPVISYPAVAPTVPPERTKIQPTKDWKTTDLDTEYNYECEGTATLNRPKGMMKLRPIGKIPGKTREETAEASMDVPDHEFKSLVSQTRTIDGWSSLDGSPRHGPSTVPRASSTMRRPPPPPPPKRSNSTKGERSVVEPKKDDVPPPIKQRPPHLAPPSQRSSLQDLEKIQDFPLVGEDFPPPPSPLPSVTDVSKSGQDVEKEPMDELFNNPLFQQKRKDSASSVDSSALPFANEAVGTIKQKASRPYPSLSAENSLRNPGSRKEKNGPRNSSFMDQQHEYDHTPEAMSPGDVIDDIEHMLANLSDQLDAMLDDEQMQK